MGLKTELNNFEFIFIEEDNDPDEEILKLAISLKYPVISNDNFSQQKYNLYRNKNIEIWNFRFSPKDFCLKIKEKWKL